uniref:Uncharacterized protein n=1 Tax=Lepeophtheirus salmonis TaxID=72036 RepID=A0A0K2TZH3_LEPSM
MVVYLFFCPTVGIFTFKTFYIVRTNSAVSLNSGFFICVEFENSNGGLMKNGIC